MQKSARAKSARKPLMDISNSRKNPSKDPSAKKIAEKRHQQDQEEAKEEEVPNKDPNIVSDGDKESSLDRLRLAHSDLSNLIRQIDELIVQAVKLNAKCKMGSQEIESFMCVVSDMQSTLKPWLPRFQQALSRPSTESDRWLGQSLLVQPESATNEERNDVPKYSEELDLGSLISPSPLVSWPANCRVESGRQLFLLTPLPKMKSFSSKCPGPSKSVSEKVPHMGTPSHALSLPPLTTISADFGDDLLESVEFEPTSTKITKSAVTLTERSNSVEFKPTSTKMTKSAVALTERSSDSSFISASQFSNQRYRDRPMLLTTPLLKMSPPKTCRYFEPVSESFQQNKNDMIKPTPLASGVIDSEESLSSEKSSSPVSGCLASKYPELFGIQLTQKSAIKRQDVEASLDWFFSPPKTCILMEPPDEKLRTNPAGCNLFSNNDVYDEQTANMVSAMDNKTCSRYQLTKKPVNHGLCSTNLAAPESTPMWKDFGSSLCKGKQPGENTLKRELWTRFEAVSTSNELHFNVSLFQETEGKGFLDRLEEVSFEETGLESKNSL
ncbi:hypothetical protein AAC387_Pa02g2672 [Persea americana]